MVRFKVVKGSQLLMAAAVVVLALVVGGIVLATVLSDSAKDLPEPGTPRNRPLGFLSFFRFAMMTLWESALSP